jgi:hypothetical protein
MVVGIITEVVVAVEIIVGFDVEVDVIYDA